MSIYRQILKARAKRWRLAPHADIPTVCVGNVTVGGTGKTPHTELILRLLQNSNRWGLSNLAMLSRGYKRRSKGYQQVLCSSTASFAGDEALQIKKKFPAVSVSVDKNRVRGCAKLVEEGADIIVMDDAFQYNRLRANLNIVMVDYSRPVFSDSLLPFGRLRDLPQRIFDAEIIIVSKCPRGMDSEEKAHFAEKLCLHSYDASSCTAITPEEKTLKLLFSYIDYCSLESVFPEADARYSYSKSVVLFTGIANDAPLRAWLSDSYKIVSVLSFPDHHKYSRSDIERITAAANRYPTSVLVTTEKDAQRLLDCGELPPEIRERLFVQPIKAAFGSEEEQAALIEELEKL
ncbi:MAG TPA: tetraacyldisaccharide 4'-kinase [Candidatus Cryptobacteroides sp.]|nr:tetraacyldisaccharide 4'-kinase [Candidatus Cryptobacteroides sp.]